MCLKLFLHDERGVSAVEYGAITTLIALVILAPTTDVGVGIAATFTYLGATFISAVFGPG